ncbi:phosphoribosylaminoimidazolesuccinocarboxamide synthase [Candidatus Saccharibacteria bacterium]|nr:phosphoribosylaminoimidazolesuccinocarboxamide synthase [Candidatus Saccharibacteria bacterium]
MPRYLERSDKMKPIKPIREGKVRDTYQLDYQTIVVVASDRVSAFDNVIPGLTIADKGVILTKMSRKWHELIDIDIGPNGKSWANECGSVFGDDDYKVSTSYLDHIYYDHFQYERSQIQIDLTMVPVECIVRGYITGSLWQAYHEAGLREFCGIELPDGLQESDKLPEPIFTPTTKAPVGQHDENIDYDQMVRIIKGDKSLQDFSHILSAEKIAQVIRDVSLFYFKKASEYALERGIIIADTKFEFGLRDKWIYLGDEILTPDSSRFWSADDYEPGRSQKSMDKQIIRDEIKRQKNAGISPIVLSDEIIKQTQDAYNGICQKLFPDA